MQNRQPLVKRGELPAWLTTYSDVITLLMTFFILLLTFSTSEPEAFQRMQRIMFGTGAADGLAGPELKSIVRNSWVVRVRPPSSRRSLSGSETQPVWTDPPVHSFNTALEGLEDPERFEFDSRHAIEVARAFIVSERARVLPEGEQLLRTLALQLRRFPCEVTFQVTHAEAAGAAGALAARLVEFEGVRTSQVAVQVLDDPALRHNRVRIVIDGILSGERGS
jgi:chemotaxis protein MotB